MNAFTDEQLFEQRVTFAAGVAGIEEFPFMRRLYVLTPSATSGLYAEARKYLKPYPDGMPKLYPTIATALAKCIASRGDIIFVLPQHTETTTAIAMSIAGVSIIGVGNARLRPTITASTTASDLIDVTAANCLIKNLRLIGAASGNTGLIHVDASGDDLTIEDCIITQAAVPVTAIKVGANRLWVKRCRFNQSANGADYTFNIITTGLNGIIVEDCFFDYSLNGLDEAPFYSAKKFTGLMVRNCTFIGLDGGSCLLAEFLSSTAAIGDGLITNCNALFNSAITLASAMDHGAVSCSNVYITDAVASRGTAYPATTAS